MAGKLAVSLVVVLCVVGVAFGGSYATTVVEYAAGDAPNYTDSSVVLGGPSLTTWETVNWPSTGAPVAVRMTESAWLDSQVLKIGVGGRLVVGFDHHVENDPANPWGVDLLVFTNTLFAATDYPTYKQLDEAGSAYDGPLGQVSVSQDGSAWYRVATVGTKFPTQAYLSDASDAFSTGAALSDFTRPVNPSLTLADFGGLTLAEGLALYNGSGGGLGVDLSNLLDGSGNPASLDWIQYVRIDGKTGAIDAFADVAVPEPATLTLVGLGAAGLAWRRQRREG